MATHDDALRVGALLTDELLDALDALYPERSPDPRMPHLDMVIGAAQRDLVRALRANRIRFLKLRGASPVLDRTTVVPIK
jgi:hypothetical protein